MLSAAEYWEIQRRFFKATGRRDPWLAVVIAGIEGRGVRLSADEAWKLARDHAVHTAAANAEERLTDDV